MNPIPQPSPGQQYLTPQQKAEAERFARERILAQLSTEPADEAAAEAFLLQAYLAGGLRAPERIHWVDGPLQLVMLLSPPDRRRPADVLIRDSILASIRETIEASLSDTGDSYPFLDIGEEILYAGVRGNVLENLEASVRKSTAERVWNDVYHCVWSGVEDYVTDRVGELVGKMVSDCIFWDSSWKRVADTSLAAVMAFFHAPELAFYHFFATHLASNDLHAFAHFNELVSGYWLGKEVALIVMNPNKLLVFAIPDAKVPFR